MNFRCLVAFVLIIIGTAWIATYYKSTIITVLFIVVDTFQCGLGNGVSLEIEKFFTLSALFN